MDPDDIIGSARRNAEAMLEDASNEYVVGVG